MALISCTVATQATTLGTPRIRRGKDHCQPNLVRTPLLTGRYEETSRTTYCQAVQVVAVRHTAVLLIVKVLSLLEGFTNPAAIKGL